MTVEKMLVEIANQGFMVALGYGPIRGTWELRMGRMDRHMDILSGSVLKEVVREGHALACPLHVEAVDAAS